MARWDIFDIGPGAAGRAANPHQRRETQPDGADRVRGRGASDDSSAAHAEAPATRARQTGAAGRCGAARTRQRIGTARYSLRDSEFEAMSDIGKFRTRRRSRPRPLRLRRRRSAHEPRPPKPALAGFGGRKIVFRAHKEPRHILTLTEQGHRLCEGRGPSKGPDASTTAL